MGYESSAERWSPVQSVEKILLSVVSMLAGEWLSLLAVAYKPGHMVSRDHGCPNGCPCLSLTST